MTAYQPTQFSSESLLNSALDLMSDRLSLLAQESDFTVEMAVTFGSDTDMTSYQTAWLNGSLFNLPDIEIVSSSLINGANGAYSRITDKIYLSEDFLIAADPESLANVITEEYGHSIDAYHNEVETIGDEGRIFAHYVAGETLDSLTLAQLQGEDDTAIAVIEGKTVTIEQNRRIYVNDDALGLNNGADWANAYTDLRIAISNATFGDEIWVAAGTYKPSLTDATVSFELKNGVKIYGGFNGTETSLEQRNWGVNSTILSGDIGVIGDNSDNTYTVVTGSVLNATAALDGFTITGGHESRDSKTGAGIYLQNSYLILSNLLITNNVVSSSRSDGGGLYTTTGGPQLSNVRFENNKSARNGGGIYIKDGNPVLDNVTFTSNEATTSGGGIYITAGSPTIANSRFSNNLANSQNADGGAVYVTGKSSPIFVNDTFLGNTALDSGGAIAVSIQTDSQVIIANSIFDRNSGNTAGAITTLQNSAVNIINSTFSQNSSSKGGAITNGNDAENLISLSNSILWGNSGAALSNSGTGTIIVANSIVQGGYTGTNVLNVDPFFVNASNGDLRIQNSSPGINQGDNSTVGTIATDIGGNTRIAGGVVDLGAYEVIFSLDSTQYLASHNDLIGVFGYNPSAAEQHYYSSGYKEGRSVDSFDGLRYVASNPDLIVYGYRDETNGAIHYITAGIYEGRSKTSFDGAQYLASNTNLISVYGTDAYSATNHYINYGYYEGRSADSFDEKRYLASNDDLLGIFGVNLTAATQHYLQYGYNEGRSTTSFNPDIYIASHADLITAVGYNLSLGTDHYLNYGASEDRSKGTFNPQSYLNLNPDLQPFYTGNLAGATQHYIQYGYNEGRDWM